MLLSQIIRLIFPLSKGEILCISWSSTHNCNHGEDCLLDSCRDTRWLSSTPYKRRVSHWRTLLKRMAVCKELTWRILKESWLRGKSVVEQAGRAMGMTAALREFEKSILRTWESFTGSGLRFQCTKSHHTQTSWCYSYCIPNIKPLLNQRQCQTSVLSGLRKKRSGLLLSLLLR